MLLPGDYVRYPSSTIPVIGQVIALDPVKDEYRVVRHLNGIFKGYEFLECSDVLVSITEEQAVLILLTQNND